jgi:glycine/D-amino acid oxidase-like deaminating enzyme
VKALIAGGGIAGLATVIALRQAGFDVEIFEWAPELREIGAGLMIWPNGATPTATSCRSSTAMRSEFSTDGSPDQLDSRDPASEVTRGPGLDIVDASRQHV